jgi:hypothetical protein
LRRRGKIKGKNGGGEIPRYNEGAAILSAILASAIEDT